MCLGKETDAAVVHVGGECLPRRPWPQPAGAAGVRGSVMCRLFGLTAGTARVRATFWLLDAPDSLQAQSHRNADGAGIGFFGPAGELVLDKQPEPAFSDQDFLRAARQAESSAFVAHVRWATAGGRTERNTHPFGMDGRVMAHNGGFGELAQLDTRARLLRPPGARRHRLRAVLRADHQGDRRARR